MAVALLARCAEAAPCSSSDVSIVQVPLPLLLTMSALLSPEMLKSPRGACTVTFRAVAMRSEDGLP
eukprot:372507-Hanusia_phi.AAC.7